MSLQNPLRANEAMYSTVKGDYFYPQTVASQVIMEDGSRLNAYLGGMVIPNGMELLWENPDPTVAFAPQTVMIGDFSPYRVIIVEFYTSTTTVTIPHTTFTLVNDYTFMFFPNDKLYRRSIRTQGNEVVFGNCTYDAGTTSANSNCIPYKIYGIKENATIGGEGTLLNANMLGGVAAEEYVKKSETGMELLWTNASPTSSFAPQTINIGGGYRAYLVIVRLATSKEEANSVVMVENIEYRIPVAYANGVFSRRAKITNGSIQFFAGANTEMEEIDNAIVIPYQIYGIK